MFLKFRKFILKAFYEAAGFLTREIIISTNGKIFPDAVIQSD